MGALNPIIKVTVRGYNGIGKLSSLIRWGTFGKFSHVSIVLWYEDGTAEEWEALQGHTLEPHPPRDDYDMELIAPLTDYQIRDAHLLLKQLQGSKYDWKGIVGIAIRKFGHQNPERWFCSELVAYVLWKAGYALSRRAPYRELPTTVMECKRLLTHEEFMWSKLPLTGVFAAPMQLSPRHPSNPSNRKH